MPRLVTEPNAKNMAMSKCQMRNGTSTIAVPEYMRLMVAMPAQANASELAAMNASKMYLPDRFGLPLSQSLDHLAN